jgi:hypothetical protein
VKVNKQRTEVCARKTAIKSNTIFFKPKYTEEKPMIYANIDANEGFCETFSIEKSL